MTDISEKSNSINISDKTSIETRINCKKYHHDAGDGPQAAYPTYCELNLTSLYESNTEEKRIFQPHKLEIFNDHDETSKAEVTHIAGSAKIKTPSKEKLSVGDNVVSNKTFSVSSLNNLAILDIFRNIQSTINQLKLSNSSVENVLSTNLEQIGSYMLSREYNRQLKSKIFITRPSNDSNTQRLQMLLLYILEQINRMNGTITDIGGLIDNLLMLGIETDENTTNEIQKKNEQINNKQSEAEEDIFNVEELSWDEHHLSMNKLNNKCHIDKNNENLNLLGNEGRKLKERQNISSTFPIQVTCSTTENKVIDNNNEESVTYASIKSQHSNSLTDTGAIEKFTDSNIGNSNSFQEIKSKFEKLKYLSKTDTKDISSPVSLKVEMDSLNNKRSSGTLNKLNISPNNHDNYSKKNENDYMENSPFLVSSINSFTESISFKNPNNNNNKFSDKYKSNMEIKANNPSIAIDLEIGKSHSQIHSKNELNNNQNHFGINNKSDQYIEVVNNVNLPNEPLYIDSPYFNSKNEHENKSKDQNSPADEIIAISELVTNLQRSLQSGSELDKECSPVYHYMKELLDTEKSYVNNLFIYSHILYNRIMTSNIISFRNLNIIFPNCIQQLYKFHVDFYNQLNNVFQNILNMKLNQNSLNENCEKNKFQEMKFGQVFLENLENDNWKFFSLYRQYHWKSQAAITLYNKLKKASPKFDRLIKILQHGEYGNNVELGSFIVLPIQRLSNYLSMLRQILNKLSCTQIDEKIPMLAVEHLLDDFIKEINTEHLSSGFIKNTSLKILDLSSDVIKINSPCEMSNEELNLEFKGYKEKNEITSKTKTSGFLKKHWSYTGTINESHRVVSPNMPFETVLESDHTEVIFNKKNINATNSLSQINIPYLNKLHINSKEMSFEHFNCGLRDTKHKKDSKSVGETKYELSKSNNHKRMQVSACNILRPQSVPLQLKFQKSKTNLPVKGLYSDTESLLSQTTDECSVCLNTQDEFEVDTSIEEDDKTCIAENSNRILKPNYSLSYSKSPNLNLIEFCPGSNNGICTGFCPMNESTSCSIKWFLSAENKFSILNNLIYNETEILIGKKVETSIFIICNILIETMKYEYQSPQPLTISDHSERNDSPMKLQVEPMEDFEDNYKSKDLESYSDFKYYIDEKKDTKKFSIKQLFSLRRKSRNDKTLSSNYFNKEIIPVKGDKRLSSVPPIQKPLILTTITKK